MSITNYNVTNEMCLKQNKNRGLKTKSAFTSPKRDIQACFPTGSVCKYTPYVCRFIFPFTRILCPMGNV